MRHFLVGLFETHRDPKVIIRIVGPLQISDVACLLFPKLSSRNKIYYPYKKRVSQMFTPPQKLQRLFINIILKCKVKSIRTSAPLNV